jgi:Zn-dependent protease with chaperone function
LLFFYLAPLAVGVILLFFMIKPLFARRARSVKLRTLEFGEEPLLFSLVTRVAKAVGAPEPKRIALDCQANASASLGGTLGFLFGGDLVLTIGLPLAAGLSIQQLAGVIAHELGHFSQGAGMRLSYLVRSINAWLYRVVYERDNWDDALVNTGREAEHLLVIVILYMAMVCIWLTRGILWLFMALGHALSCFMLRQMEYDADRYETRLTGAESFAATDRKLLSLGLVSEMAFGMVLQSWVRTGRLPDDFSALIHGLADSVAQRERRKIEKNLKKIKTGFFDTHPAYADRLASVRRENAPGVFHLDGPATRLFKDFPQMSRAVTLHFYREAFGNRVKPAALVPVAVYLGE